MLFLLFSGCEMTSQAKGGKPTIKPGLIKKLQCNDKKDNDGDGYCDLTGCYIGRGKNKQWYNADSDCDNETDNKEGTDCVPSQEICDNAVDDDCDSLTDCNDIDCSSDPFCESQLWKGIIFSPIANNNNNHAIFLQDFEDMVITLSDTGINTIVFDITGVTGGAYDFNSTPRLDDHTPQAKSGFTFEESREMARISRENGMRIVVVLNFMTHQNYLMGQIYPEYMIPEPQWNSSISYGETRRVSYGVYSGDPYIPDGTPRAWYSKHSDNLNNAPFCCVDWALTTAATRDPFNNDYNAASFIMIDELIDAFTYEDQKPEAFHIGFDELKNWYDCPLECAGMSSAELFAKAINDTYDYLNANHPDVEVMVWGDMLYPGLGGGALRNTTDARDLISNDIIIADWRYSISPQWYDYDTDLFIPVEEFVSRGFRVWSTSWMKIPATEDFIWTQNWWSLSSDKPIGNLYSFWSSAVVPELRWNLLDIGSPTDGRVTAVAEAIESTIDLIGIEQCRGTDTYCGSYPDCENCNLQDGFFGEEFRNYYCNANACEYNAIILPTDYVSYWKFEGNADDENGVNNGAFMNTASIVDDVERGQVVSFTEYGDYVNIPGSPSTNITQDITISMWVKRYNLIGHVSYFNMRYTTNQGIMIYNNPILAFGNSSSVTSFYADSSLQEDTWHHIVGRRNGEVLNLFMNGVKQANTKNISGPTYFAYNPYISLGKWSGYQLNGSIDDVMIFNRALSDAEIGAIYNSQKS